MSDAALCLAAASAGAEVVRLMYAGPLARHAKSPGDFATEADLASEAAILHVLRRGRPGDALLGEEAGASGDASSTRTWLVDPLCGTLNYAAETPLAAVNVALRRGHHVAVAAVADPLAREVYWTDGESVRVRRGGVDTPGSPSAASRLVDLNLDAPPPHHNDPFALALLADPAFAEAFRPRVLSTTLALAWVAVGRRGAYVTRGEDLGDSVHFAAGIALCVAAGCVVTGLDGGPVRAGAEGLVAAADADTHAVLLEAVARVRWGRA
jgi:myo-inositol-1(or 4)-monophosphatase